METTTAPVRPARTPEWFRDWWRAQRVSQALSAPVQSSLGLWWRALPGVLRRFLAESAALQDTAGAIAGEFETLTPQDRDRLMSCVRSVSRDLDSLARL
jgi:hypothetical protein